MPRPRGPSPEDLLEARQALEVLRDRSRDDQVRRDASITGRYVQLPVDRFRKADSRRDPPLAGKPGTSHGVTVTRRCDGIADTRAQKRALRRPPRTAMADLGGPPP